MLCPRNCGVNRSAGELGTCGQRDVMKIAGAFRHFGEEPPLVAAAGSEPEEGGGSGTIFFSGCTLRCGFCQNRQLSRSEIGQEVSIDEFVEICLRLQNTGAFNINLVSATPFIPSILEGLERARCDGLALPVLWNCSGYESMEAVDALSREVDIFLPDLKLLDTDLSARLFAAPDYPERAAAAVEQMISHGSVEFGPDGTLRRGTLVRHLVLPGLLKQTEEVLRWCADRGVGRSMGRSRGLLSLMMQFGVPDGLRGWKRGVAEIENRPLTPVEYDRLLALLDELGFEEGYIQEPGDEEPWWPDFTRQNPFPAGQAVRVWPR